MKDSSRQWTAGSIPDQRNRTVIVTGASSGIGLVAARELAGKGAHVVLAVRDLLRGEVAAASIRERVPEASLAVAALDLADLGSIAAFASGFRATHTRLDLLLNNAGVMTPPLTRTADGFELQMGVNHLAHVALTNGLLDMLTATEASRIVTVSSLAHWMGNINFEDINWTSRRYRSMQAYADSKIANLYFTFELQRRLTAMKSSTIAVAAHPGVSMTLLWRHSRVLEWFGSLIAHDVEEAALPSLRAATDPSVQGGSYYGPGKFMELRGTPERARPAPRATDEAIARRLWEISESLISKR